MGGEQGRHWLTYWSITLTVPTQSWSSPSAKLPAHQLLSGRRPHPTPVHLSFSALQSTEIPLPPGCPSRFAQIRMVPLLPPFSWESLGLQGGETKTKSTLNIHWKDCCWSWISNTLAIWCKELTHWKRFWWERLKAKGEAGSRGWDD